MTNGLGIGDAYDTTIGRIKAEGGERSRLGMAALMWISHSERPLNVDELCHALAVEIESTDINTNNIPSIRTVLGCCQGLVAVDKGSLTIRLIHFTLKEYLSHHADLFDKPHSVIAETCLTYLNFQAIKELSAHPEHDFQGPPFLEYASLHWGTHMRMEFSDRSRHLARDLLDQCGHHISHELLSKSLDQPFKYSSPHSALHYISYFGIAEVAIDLISMKRWDVKKRDGRGLTPLMWAARYGREEVAKLLLEQKHTQPDIRDRWDGRTALSWAAGSGHEGVVRLFLSRLFISPGSIGRRWGTPQVMSLLFGRKYVNPDRPDNHGQTPLGQAARKGHEGVVKLLLEREDVNPDRPDNHGRTPLSWAAANGSDEVVRLLLERKDVRPDIPDNYGRTPFWWAAYNGCEGVVKLLLEREDVNPNRPDNDGRTPLSWAAEKGHEGVVKLLLEREDVSPDRPDNHGRTLLSRAAENDHDEFVGLLLKREDINPNRPDNHGRTPLSWAAENGHGEFMWLLLKREDISPNRPDNNGRTPLSWAAEFGREGVVRLLLEREDVNPDRPDNDGRTPLRWAARCKYKYNRKRVVKLLKARKAAASNAV